MFASLVTGVIMLGHSFLLYQALPCPFGDCGETAVTPVCWNVQARACAVDNNKGVSLGTSELKSADNRVPADIGGIGQ